MRRRIISLIMMIAVTMVIGGCVAGIQEVNPNPTPPIVPPAIDDLALIDGTVSTMTWTEPDDVASYSVTVTDQDGGQWEVDPPPDPCGAGNACEFPVLGLDREETYSFAVNYENDAGDASDDTLLDVDTSWKQKTYSAPVVGQAFGTFIEVGNTGDPADPVPAILIGYDDDNESRPLLFAGGRAALETAAVLDPQTEFFVNQSNFGNPAALGDVDCDGVDDVIVSSRRCDDNLGRAFVFSGAAIGEGVESIPDATLAMPVVASSLINNSAVTGYSNSDSCESLWLGASNENVFRGAVYGVYDPAGITADINVPNGGTALQNYAGVLVGSQAGRFAFNVGDVDGDGLDELVFNSAQAVVDFSWILALRFNDEGVDWGNYTTFPTAEHPNDIAGPLGEPGQFYLSTGVRIDATTFGAKVSMHDGRTNLPNDPVLEFISPTLSFGIGVVVDDIDQQTAGDELLIGTADSINVYDDFTVTAGFDTTPSRVWNIPGLNIKLVDFNEDGYLDIVSADMTADPDGVLYINY